MAAFSGGLTLVSQGVEPDERGSVPGLICTVVYLAFVVPSIGCSLLAPVTSSLVAAAVFAALVTALCTVSAVVLRRSSEPGTSPA